jgi:hypothetical protein
MKKFALFVLCTLLAAPIWGATYLECGDIEFNNDGGSKVQQTWPLGDNLPSNYTEPAWLDMQYGSPQGSCAIMCLEMCKHEGEQRDPVEETVRITAQATQKGLEDDDFMCECTCKWADLDTNTYRSMATMNNPLSTEACTPVDCESSCADYPTCDCDDVTCAPGCGGFPDCASGCGCTGSSDCCAICDTSDDCATGCTVGSPCMPTQPW